ncbi:hypothetical protein BJ322DRAFT_278471 [Thelephora terrestris]|uniref:Protein kinase domain-containing protein n=1 Tax=Thelephora terrestris TaxID=56493 RepID=A0A9P6H8F2_9AGAM|nr:hypothetical protein BJ322DRAFT_278471 [Thelephora terrestris]
MSSPSNSPTPSPKSSPRLKSLPLPPLPHGSSSESSTTVKISSPLNPSTSPKRTTPLSSSPENEGIEYRLRVDSTSSTARSPSPARLDALSRIITTNSLQRGRSRSPHGGRTGSRSRESDNHSPELGDSWWGSREHLARPWHEPLKRKKTIPPEQTERWEVTRERVQSAAVSVLGTAGDVAHELLRNGVDLLGFVPIPGLDAAARTLLQIWDTLQQVDMNRLACLRLTQRCADILLSIREEVREAGDEVTIELQAPIGRLVDAFANVLALMQRQVNRPFLKRYLKRDDILRAIQGCDAQLNDSLNMFNLSIQIRILRQIHESDRQRQAEMEVIISQIKGRAEPPVAAIETAAFPVIAPVTRAHTGENATIEGHVTSLAPDEVADLLRTCLKRQNEQDLAYDAEDLRQVMQSALQTGSDADMLDVLQVSREEMPEALKTLQRALEEEVQKERSVESSMIEDVAVFSEEAEPLEELTNSPTSGSTSSKLRTDSCASARARASRDTLDREFLESGIEALRRMSEGVKLALPYWTITKWEIDREEKIGVGFFSDVYKGSWRGITVAIKVLAPTTPRKLFVHEVGVWKTLSHTNVLELFGASSTTGEPPWFFVSPYLKYGSLVKYLKNLNTHSPVNLLKMIYEVAMGMAYLHENGVLHGDLKAANVLVDDEVRCVISDFGQSEMKSEVWRVSGKAPPHGTLRWQAPELMAGSKSKFLASMDIYAFAICCVEILNKGNLPWPLLDDDAVRRIVLNDNGRPDIPNSHPWTKDIAQIIGLCWKSKPASRPQFSKVVKDLEAIGQKHDVSLQHATSDVRTAPRPEQVPMSPDMHPVLGLPPFDDDVQESDPESTYVTPDSDLVKWRNRQSISSIYKPEVDPESPSATTRSSGIDGEDYAHIRVDSPSALDDPPANSKDERRYRMLLRHEFHPSLTLPLWSPSTVKIGSVGYLRKPEGEFMTLFSAFDPPETSDGVLKGMASLYGYGQISQGSYRQDKRNRALRGLDVLQSWLSSRLNTNNINRRYSFSLKADRKTAFLCVESTMYTYIEDLSAPKKWFKANVDEIMKYYGDRHPITKEDLFLVIGTLSAPEYALFVSHSNPDMKAHFNVFTSPRPGRPWGEFATTEDTTSSTLTGPHYKEEPTTPLIYHHKVSEVSGEPWHSLLLARLRFKPDSPEPTSL